MDAAAPETAEPQEKAEPKAEPRKRSWWRVKIPTAVVVTFVGIALTAWLLPAFTRQWDDRQKAQDLKASIASQLAAATSRALLQSKQAQRQAALLDAMHPPPSEVGESMGPLPADVEPLRRALARREARALAAEARLEDAWLFDSVKLEAKLRAYFSPDMVRRLHAYNLTMAVLFSLATHGAIPFDEKRTAAILGVTPSRLHRDARAIFDRSASAPTTALDPGLSIAEYGYVDLTNGVLETQNALVTSILNAHVNGYSPTTRDLINDLLPF